MPAGFYRPTSEVASAKKFIIYGNPKSVKTPLALAYGAYLRSLNPKSITLYVAADRGSEDLPSCPDPSWKEENGGFIRVWCPGSPLDPGYDPYREAIQLSMTNWKDPNAKINDVSVGDPNIELIVWDTFSEDMERILQYVADKEYFSSTKTGDKHITFGDPTLPKGHPARMNIPLPADYNGVGGIAKRIVDGVCAQDCHVLLLSWEEEIKDKLGVKRVGPAFVGKALTGKLPGKLTGVIYTEKFGEIDDKTGKLKSQLYVCSDPGDDMHIAGVRHESIDGDPKNPIPRVKVGSDLVAYWKLFFETLFPMKERIVA